MRHALTLFAVIVACGHSQVRAQDEAINTAVEAPALDQDDELPVAQPAEDLASDLDQDAKAEEEPLARAEPAVRPLAVSATLTDRSIITGTLIDSTAISIKTAFGEASLPLSEVAGIRFPAAEDSGTTVVMLNGDSISGVTNLKFINVETTWGSAKINGQSIGNLLFVPGLTWKSTESLGGRRWILAEKSAAQTQAQSTASVQPAASVPRSSLNTPRSSLNTPSAGQRLPNSAPPVLGTVPSNRLPTPAPQIIYGR
ncbi:MAG TPA: hypothetical protein DDW52_02365 [Planctomycetaceae bacterium]|nr:hypothetical protein [Planctomycetaceae bacterium]